MSGSLTAPTRQAWIASVAAILPAAGAGAVTIIGADRFSWVVLRLVVLALACLVVGLLLASEHVVSLSVVPILLATTGVGAGRQEVVWPLALAVGCLWFVSVELGLGALAMRAGIRLGPRVARQRGAEVATVVTSALGVGLVGLLAVSWTPGRSIGVQAVVAVSVLTTLTLLLRRARTA